MHLRHFRPVFIILLLMNFCASSVVLADPPPWAPAHGYHKNKNKNKKPKPVTAPPPRPADQYVYRGSCKWEDLGTVIGGVVGGAAGSQVGKGDGKTAATIIGTIVGAIIGSTVGRTMDETDTACIGQALEYGPIGRHVQWTNPDTGAVYRITPTREYKRRDGSWCREYSRNSFINGRREQADGAACRSNNGEWNIIR